MALTVVLGACNGGDDEQLAGETTSTAAPGSTAGSEPTTDTTRAAAAEIDVILAADRLVVGGNALVYGAPASQVRAYLDRALGTPTASEEQECGPGRLESHQWPGITTYVAEDGFGGWVADDGTYATDQGIRVGSSRAALEAAYPSVTVTESSLGTEFFVPGPEDGSGLSGIYEDDEVAALWSGATCVAR